MIRALNPHCSTSTGRRWSLRASVLLTIATGAALGQESSDDTVNWQLLWHNDGFANSDNQFTNGVSVRRHSPLGASLEDTGGRFGFAMPLARWTLPERVGLNYRSTSAFGQNMHTPDRITVEEIMLNDVPYVGMIGWSNSYIAFDDRDLYGIGAMIGFVGEAALAEQAQHAAHRLTGANDPKGWDNQLDFEPLLNLYVTRKRKLWSRPGFSGSIAADAALGNFFTLAQAAMEITVGNAPRGFMFQPVPIGRGMDYDAALRAPGAAYTYLTFTARVTGIGFALPREGNLLRGGNEWTNNNVIDPERRVTQFVVGMHHERPHWGVHLSFWYSSDTVKGNRAAAIEDPQNSFGTITVDWRPRRKSGA